MLLGEHVLLRERWPNAARRRAVPGLGLVPGVAVVPHFDGGGGRWRADGGPTVLGIDERTAALWRPGQGWSVLGPGRVAVVRAGEAPVVCPPGSLSEQLAAPSGPGAEPW
jgi:cyanophycinase-like exopeptidase